tara:strand:+ start:984 stop:1367 length:384 start_codon:yes stop_codon:yes gene_type:complete
LSLEGKNAVHDYRLPYGLNVIADAAGVDAALQIALERGGSRIRIPQKARGSILEEMVGIEAAQKIAAALSDERIEIPVAKRVLAQWLQNKGWSQERISSTLKVSRRTIQYWKADKTRSRQPDLLEDV